MKEWINVKDELPKTGISVLCYYYPMSPVMEGRIIGISRRVEAMNERIRRYIDNNGFANAAEVTHWMPLPPPPAESNNTK